MIPGPMAVFLICRVSQPVDVRDALDKEFRGNFFDLGYNSFLVSADRGTAKSVSDRIGLFDGARGSGLVVRVRDYFGRGPAEIWDWLEDNVG